MWGGVLSFRKMRTALSLLRSLTGLVAATFLWVSCTPQTNSTISAVQPSGRLGGAASGGAAVSSTVTQGEGDVGSGTTSGSASGSGGGGASNEGGGSSARASGEVAAQPTPLGGGVFAPGPSPQDFCSVTVAATYSIQCVHLKSNRANMMMSGTVHYGRGCQPMDKGAPLRLVNSAAPAEFIDIVTALDGAFKYTFTVRNSPVWEFYWVDASKTPYFVTLGDPQTAVFEMQPCREELCTFGEGRADLDASVQFEKPTALTPGATLPDCGVKAKDVPKDGAKNSGEGIIILN